MLIFCDGHLLCRASGLPSQASLDSHKSHQLSQHQSDPEQ